ncbi:alpha/beta fold hydrolase [Bradyrhizobium sp. STM 3557]|uniref:alpha/beta fold hydrolase n=1 Tax=Bradyrhizobium sp. STM 3557 TaxID=578920 RepID=UPI00388DB955
MSTYVLVHGAWHTGAQFAPVAAHLRQAGHTVFTPTIAGNRSDDVKTTGLAEAIQSILDYLVENSLSNVILLGHSYGGMVITGVADRIPERLRRLIYWVAFVPNDGEALVDMVPPDRVAILEALAAGRGDGSVVLPFQVWREAFINDADLETATRAYELLNLHPFRTFTEKISLRTNPAEMVLPKSYLVCTEDTALPHGAWRHPRLSEKLGLFRLVQTTGSHELCFSDPARLAKAILEAGRD